jgi:hypothetical protein
MAAYKIFKDDGKLNLIFYCNSTSNSPQNAIKEALNGIIDPKHHKGHWVAINSNHILTKNKYEKKS